MLILAKENFTIKSVEVVNYMFVRILPDVNYERLQEQFHNLPSKKACIEGKRWIQAGEKPCIIKVYLKSGLLLTYTIKAGYNTDFASVPKGFWSVLDSSDYSILVAAIIHDCNFGCHFFDFDDSNLLFLNSMKHYKMGFIKRWLAYIAVSTPIGKSHFKRRPSEIKEELKKVSFEWDIFKKWEPNDRSI